MSAKQSARERAFINYSKFCLAGDSDSDDDFAEKVSPARKRNKTDVGNGSFQGNVVQSPKDQQRQQKQRPSLDDRLFEKDIAKAIEESIKEDSLKGSQEAPFLHSTPISGAEDPLLLSPNTALAREDTIVVERRKPEDKKLSLEDSDDDFVEQSSESNFSEDSDYEVGAKGRRPKEPEGKKPVAKNKVGGTPKARTPVRLSLKRSPKKSDQEKSPVAMQPHAAKKGKAVEAVAAPSSAVRRGGDVLAGIEKLETPKRNKAVTVTKDDVAVSSLSASEHRDKPVRKSNTGLRLGLSRKARVKPLHPYVKPVLR